MFTVKRVSELFSTRPPSFFFCTHYIILVYAFRDCVKTRSPPPQIPNPYRVRIPQGSCYKRELGFHSRLKDGGPGPSVELHLQDRIFAEGGDRVCVCVRIRYENERAEQDVARCLSAYADVYLIDLLLVPSAAVFLSREPKQ